MNKTHRILGVYAITDPIAGEGKELLEHVQQALEGGVRVLQYRDKSAQSHRQLTECRALLEMCNAHQATFIINDDVELAAAVGAHGIHIGKNDAALAKARQQLGPDAIIGVSCYNQLPLAISAAEAGADYVAFGRFFASRTKPDAIQAELEILTQAKAELSLPVVAIGGISPENGSQLIEHGADALAIIQGIFAQPDIRAAAERHAALFQ